ncbi:nuclear transport factor 2 family protein [uncultured Roseibium sp.]|uniref:YybH family protein n=1 Tax=uncultured Roseibium sp. TaxID=1936171 RepID=UPI00260317E6|nr:nuclear transport factor 2 family protein [uncultured Roseibium sp.]
MDDKDAVMAALNDWMEGLDSGDLERMVKTCDPEVVVCNERQPTTVGIQAIRDKYGPRIEANTFRSGFEIEHFKVYGDQALMVGHFTVEFTEKKTGRKGGGAGRLVLTYRKHPDGSWKLLLDIDNNGERNAT